MTLPFSFVVFIYITIIMPTSIGYTTFGRNKISHTRLFTQNQRRYSLSGRYSLTRIDKINYTSNHNVTIEEYNKEGLCPPTQYLQDDNQTMERIKSYFYMQYVLNSLNIPSVSILTKINILKNATDIVDNLSEYVDTLQPNVYAGGLLDDWN